MDAALAVVRPKQLATISREFRSGAYEILLTDLRLPGQSTKQLPKTTMRFEEETADLLCSFLYELTGAEYGGLKGKRAVFVPPSSNEPVDDSDTGSKGVLYCVSVDSREKLSEDIVESLPGTPGFYSFDQVLDSMNSSRVAFTRLTKILLVRLELWLRDKHNVPGAIDLLFSSSAEERLQRSVTNPAYFSESQSGSLLLGEGNLNKTLANEALAKMMSIEKCDITVINPLFSTSSDLCYKTKVDKVVINPYFGRGKPDYSRIVAPPHSEGQRHNSQRHWTEEFPLHKAAFEGNADKVIDLIKKDATGAVKRDHDGWCALHYAAWSGHTDVIEALIKDGESSPNILTGNQATALHIAAGNGRYSVVESLLKHPDIDVGALDRNGKTALELCKNVDKPKWQDTARLLTEALSRPAALVTVTLMDGSHRNLRLVSAANTTVQQLHQQMLRELDLPEPVGHLFTLWICSRSLQLQLKPEHKPVQHLNDWKQSIIRKWTDQDPALEDPQLFWRRDATCVQCMSDERKVQHPTAIYLLFHEAYHHYVKSLYPCAEQDVLILGGILMQFYNGDFDQKKCRNYLASDRALATLVPTAKLHVKSVNWGSRVTAQYKHYSHTMQNRDRSAVVLQQHFLTICWNLTVYGSAFFTGYVHIRSTKTATTVFVGVNDIGIHIINSVTKAMVQSFSYKDVDYAVKEQQHMLEIQLKSNTGDRGGMAILSKQAGMICNLMKKLDRTAHPAN